MVKVLPTDATVLGLSFADWTANWWIWAYSIPKGNNPLLDDNGSRASEGQSGGVWFLAGTYGPGNCPPAGRVIRKCAAPQRNILVPIVNTFRHNLEPNESTATNGALAKNASNETDLTTSLQVKIDGDDIPNLIKYRVGPIHIQFKLPASDPLIKGMDGKTVIGVSDGYWIFLEPLEAGPHQIDIDGTISQVFPTNKQFCVHVTYQLVVESAFPNALDSHIRI